MPSFEVVVAITSDFHWELQPFFYLLNRYWPDQPITVLSDKDAGIGEYVPFRTGITGEWHGAFSNALYRFLDEDCQSDCIVLLMADHWLVSEVDARLLSQAVRYMQNRLEAVIRLDLSPGPVGQAILAFSQGDLEFYRCPDHQRDCFLQGAIVPAMWNRKLLLETLQSGWGLWDAEKELSKCIIERGLESLLVLPKLYQYQHIASTRSKTVDLRNIEFAGEIKPMIPGGYTVYE